MELYPLRSTRSMCIEQNPYWEYRLDHYTTRDGREHPYYYVHTRGSVMVIPFVGDGRIVMVRQFRYLGQRESLEFPGGGIPGGVSAQEQALRELSEESGFSAAKLEHIGSFNPMNGVTDEWCVVFSAHDLCPSSRNTDPTEEIVVEILDVSELRACIARGDIWDGRTLAAWALYQAQRQ
jgi:ADP-ribose pyrophosphatase